MQGKERSSSPYMQSFLTTRLGIFRNVAREGDQPMKLTREEIAYIRSKGLHLTEKCDGCGKFLNQAARWTIKDAPRVFCSAACRDQALFGSDYTERKNRRRKIPTSPGCLYCGEKMEGKRAGARFCSPRCKMAFRRSPGNHKKGRLSVTAGSQNQSLASP